MERKMGLKYLVWLVLTVVIVASLIACAQPAPAPTPAPVPAPKPSPSPTSSPAPTPSPSPAAQETPAQFFAKNPVTLIVGWGAGGGTDFAARLVAAFWAEVFGGDARVKNVTGAGGIIATNTVWKAKPDGLTLNIARFGSSIAAPALLKDPGMEYKIDKFGYIGLYVDEPYTLAVGKDLPYNSLEDLRKAKGLKFGVISKVGGPPAGCVTLIDALGLTDAVVISGFESLPEISLSISRGELQAVVQPTSSVAAEVAKGYLKVLATIDYNKSALFPKAPAMSEALKLTPEQDKLLKVYTSVFRSGIILLAPPALPDDKLTFLRDGWDKMMKNKGFQNTVKSRYGFWETPVSGKDVAKEIDSLLNIPAKDIARMNELINKYVK